jgi:hypothetical protein
MIQRFFPVCRAGHVVKANPAKLLGVLQDHARKTIAGFDKRQAMFLETTNKAGKDLRTSLQFLDPLVAGSYPTRQLIVETQQMGWVRMFSNNIQFAGLPSRGAFLTDKLQTDSVFFMLQPHTLRINKSRSEGEPGAFQFVYYHCGEKRRVVELVYDGAWKFSAFGTPFAFEDLKRYAVRKITERFTASMLVDMLARFGLYPFCDDFHRVDTRHPARGITIDVRSNKLLEGDFKPVSLDKIVRKDVDLVEIPECDTLSSDETGDFVKGRPL